jgi:hypothetical protein
MKYRDLGFLALLAVGVLACADDPAVPMEPSAPEGPSDPPPSSLDISVGGSITVPGSVVKGDPYCDYSWIWWEDFFEPCASFTFNVAGPGILTLALDFTPEDCRSDGGLWLSLGRPAAGTNGYVAGCEPFNTSWDPVMITEPDSYRVTVGLHATPDGWPIGRAAEFTLRAMLAPAESSVRGSPIGHTQLPRRAR